MRQAWTVEEKENWDRRMREMFKAMHDRWPALLGCKGVDDKILAKKNMPCPLCEDGGTDRFQFTDKFGDGNYHCRKCGAGGGFKLLQGIKGWTAGETLREIEGWLGTSAGSAPVGQRAEQSSADKLRRAEALWNEGVPIRPGDAVDKYIRRQLGAGLDVYPASLRRHRCLGYFEPRVDGQGYHRVGEFPALLAKLVAPDASFAALQRIWLTEDGCKAPVPEPKKTLGDRYAGAAVRFAEVDDDKLMVGEGVENSLAVFIRFGVPTWSAVNAGNLRKVWVPDRVRRLWLYGDNDADTDFEGQVAVYQRARDFKQQGKRGEGREVYPHIPKIPGTDWKQVFRHSLESGVRGKPGL